MRTSWKKPPENGATRNKLLWSLAALGAAGALAGLGTFATFTTTTTEQSGVVDTGHVELTVGNAGSLAVSDIVPGDTIERVVDLTNGGETLATLTLLVTSDTANGTEPYEDPARAMTLTVDDCANAWSPSGNGFICSGGATGVYSGDLLGAHRFTPDLGAQAAGGSDHLRLKLEFLDYAGDNYQAQQTTLRYTFLGVQRDPAAQ